MLPWPPFNVAVVPAVTLLAASTLRFWPAVSSTAPPALPVTPVRLIVPGALPVIEVPAVTEPPLSDRSATPGACGELRPLPAVSCTAPVVAVTDPDVIVTELLPDTVTLPLALKEELLTVTGPACVVTVTFPAVAVNDEDDVIEIGPLVVVKLTL